MCVLHEQAWPMWQVGLKLVQFTGQALCSDLGCICPERVLFPISIKAQHRLENLHLITAPED